MESKVWLPEDVMDHLAVLIREEIGSKNELKGLDKLEVFSHYLRKHSFKLDDLLTDQHLKDKLALPKKYQHYAQSTRQAKQRLDKIDDHRARLRADTMQEYYALRTAGLGVGKTNAYYINQAMKTIAIEYDAKSLRFWGKILGQRDYFVLQGTTNKQYLADLGDSAEKYGEGVNFYSYWVSSDVLGCWNELPLVTDRQMRASRDFKYVFTGDLEREVPQHPEFCGLGREKHLLKCIVARVTHSCELAPKGFYKLNEQTPLVVEVEEEFKLPEVAQLANIDSWVHLNSHILSLGRCTYTVDHKLTEEQREALNAELAEKDPMVERLKAIGEDKPSESLGFTANWAVSMCGETTPVSQIGKDAGQSATYGVVLVRNLVWPGACTVAYRGGWVNFYSGYGHRISQQYNAIRELKELLPEGTDLQQMTEPNPTKPKKEKDVEAQPKKEEVGSAEAEPNE